MITNILDMLNVPNEKLPKIVVCPIAVVIEQSDKESIMKVMERIHQKAEADDNVNVQKDIQNIISQTAEIIRSEKDENVIKDAVNFLFWLMNIVAFTTGEINLKEWHGLDLDKATIIFEVEEKEEGSLQ